MRKPALCICENKDADQLRGNREADQRLCFCYTDDTIPLLPTSIRNFKPLAIFFSCTAWFVSDQVGNPEDRFSQNEAHIILRTRAIVILVRKERTGKRENKIHLSNVRTDHLNILTYIKAWLLLNNMYNTMT